MGEIETLIVGGGVAGLATAWALAQRGERGVVLAEREDQLGAHSSGKNAAILRTLVDDPVTAQLLRAGGAFLAAPPANFSELPLLDPCGLLIAAEGEHGQRLVAEARRAGDGYAVERLDASRRRELVPHYAGAPLELFLPTEGHLDVAALLEGFARGARRGGVALETGVEVAELLVEGGEVRGARLADGAELRARTTVLAAGGWASGLGAAAGARLELVPRRRHLLVTAADAAVDPRWPVVWDDRDGGFYARPESGGLLLCGCDQSDVDPDRCPVDSRVLETIGTKTARHLPAFADAGSARLWCGMRTFARDGRFAVGPDPDLPGLFWVAALGGHGMCVASEIGRIAAERIAGGAPRGPLEEALDPRRLTSRTAPAR